MIVAEESNAVRIEEQNQFGGLPHKIGQYYKEFLIINYMNEPIYAVDYCNQAVVIQPHPALIHGQQRKVEIRNRTYIGPADRRSYDTRQLENTPGKHVIMQLSFDTLRSAPHFVEMLNIVLCLGDQLSIADHPHSRDAIADRVRIIKEETEARLAECPIVLNANDPSGKIDELFVEINGTICAARVTHFIDESDRIVLSLRDQEHSWQVFTRHTTTFTDLLKQGPRVWTLGAFRLASNRTWFEKVLEIERDSEPITIPVDAVEALIEQARTKDADKINVLLEEKKELQRRFSALETTHDALLSGDYHEEAAALLRDKLEFERIKLRQQQAEVKMNLEGERLKLRKEIIAIVGVVAKTAAVMVPVGIGIYKAIKVAKAT
jgi:hypothetical protein